MASGSEKYNQVKENRNRIFVNNFIGGVAWALGATIGFTVLIAILTTVLKYVNLVPYVGNFVIEVQKFITENSQTLHPK